MKHTDYWYEVDADEEWPKSENCEWEEVPDPDAPFDYKAKPTSYYIDVETVGNLPPNEVVLRSIETLQRKLADIAIELNKESVEASSTANNGGLTTYGRSQYDNGGDSPGMGRTPYGGDSGFGGASSWNA